MQGIETAPAAPGIYAITAPDGRRYVGRAVNMQRRARQHARRLARGAHGNAKLQAYAAKHGEESLRFVPLLVAPAAEESALAFLEASAFALLDPFGARGFNLSREAAGGAGVYADPEVRARHAANLRAALADPEVRERAAAAGRARMSSPEARARASAAAKSPAARAAINAAQATPEARARNAAAQTLRWQQAAERKARLAEESRARWADPEFRARMSAKHKARANSPEGAAQMALARAAKKEPQQ